MPAVAENRRILTDADGAQVIVAERTTLLIKATLQDETGVAIPSAALQTLTLTLYARDSTAKTIINSVDDVNILNTGRGTVNATSGLLLLDLLPDDNQIIDTAADLEWHRALLEGTYAGGAKAFKYELDYQVRNLNKVS